MTSALPAQSLQLKPTSVTVFGRIPKAAQKKGNACGIGRRILMLHQGRIYADQSPDDLFKSDDPVIHRFVNGIYDPREQIVV